MKKIETDFLLLLEYVATGKCNKENDWKDSDWVQLFNLCYQNKMLALAYDYVKDIDSLPENIKKQWEQVRFYTFLRQKKSYHALKTILVEFEKNNIKYATFKGNVISNLYKNPYYRITSDSDVFVDEQNRVAATNIILSYGYEIDEEEQKDTFVTVFFNEAQEHKIELHTSLFEDYSGKQIDLLNKLNLTDENKRITLNIDGFNLITLGHEEHLVFQVFHFAKHFIVDGVSIRYLVDITLFINKYFNEIDWNIFWKHMEVLNYKDFMMTFFYLCKKYTGLTEQVLSINSINPEVEERILLDLIYVGNVNNQKKGNYALISDFKGYLEGDTIEIDDSKIYSKLKLFFPNQNDIHPYYAYAKRNKYLLPIAWIHRLFHGIRNKIEKRSVYDIAEKTIIVDERKHLISDFGLATENKKRKK